MNILKKSGANEGYTGGFPFGAFMLLVLILAAITISLLPWSKPQKVEAQFAGQSTFSLPFNINIPGSSSTPQYTIIPNRGQVAETISYSWDANCAPPFTSGNIYLEGSNDNANWFVLTASAGVYSSTGSAVMYSNGYFTYKRLSFPACGTSALASTYSGTYTGYTIPLPLNNVTPTIFPVSVQAAAALGPVGFYLVSGFQCFNPNASTAYLAIGSDVLIIGIPAGQVYNYQGPAFLGNRASTNIGAYTTPALSTAVSTAVPCTVELTSGPFYPLSPPIFF
jgi:hypothetical protein